MPPLRPISKEDTHLGGHNTWFFDDIELLRQRWHSDNTETVAELLIDFFRYFSRDFPYNVGVASIRAGLLKKESKGWQNDLSAGRYNDARERNRICIEDPFEVDFNVARCVTRDGLYTIRGEFMRACRILQTRPDRAILALADLCEERPDEELVSAPNYAPRQVPPQTPYSVGSRPLRPKAPPLVVPPMPAPVARLHESNSNGPSLVQQVSSTPPPAHMAPKRSKWTSPPPPEASSADRTLYENQLGAGLELATAATEAREREEAYHSSSSNSEILDDIEERSDIAESDDVRSIRSYTEGASSMSAGPSFRRPSWLVTGGPNPLRLAQAQVDVSNEPPSRFLPGPRGRVNRFVGESSAPSSFKAGSAAENSKRSSSGPSRQLKGHSPLAVSIPLPPSPESPNRITEYAEPATVFYQTGHSRSPHSTFLYPNSGSHSSSPISPYHTHSQHYSQYYLGANIPHDIFPTNLPPMFTSSSAAYHPQGEKVSLAGQAGVDMNVAAQACGSAGFNTPTLSSTSSTPSHPSHQHSHSTATIVAPTTPSHASLSHSQNKTVIDTGRSPVTSSRPPSRSQSPPAVNADRKDAGTLRGGSATADATSASRSDSNDSSPTPSSTGYATSVSRSPSPTSLSPPHHQQSPPLKKGLGLGLEDDLTPGAEMGMDRVALIQAPNSEAVIEVGIDGINIRDQIPRDSRKR